MSGLRIDNNFADHLDLVDKEGKLTNGINIGLVLEDQSSQILTYMLSLILLKKDRLMTCMLIQKITEQSVVVKPIIVIPNFL